MLSKMSRTEPGKRVGAHAARMSVVVVEEVRIFTPLFTCRRLMIEIQVGERLQEEVRSPDITWA